MIMSVFGAGGKAAGGSQAEAGQGTEEEAGHGGSR